MKRRVNIREDRKVGSEKIKSIQKYKRRKQNERLAEKQSKGKENWITKGTKMKWTSEEGKIRAGTKIWTSMEDEKRSKERKKR